jgi:Flp pilus assembly pilin Flp
MGDKMSAVLSRVLSNNNGFSAIEYGLIAAVTLILAGQLVSKFQFG